MKLSNIGQIAFLALGVPLAQANFTVYHADGTTTSYADTFDNIAAATLAAIDGDDIQCTGGFNYVAPLNHTIHLTDHGSGWVLLRSSHYRSLPDSRTRITATTHTCQLTTASNFSSPLLVADAGAHNWTLDGISASGISNVPFSALFATYDFGAAGSPGGMAYNLTFDHLYLTGTYNSPGPCRGMWLNGAHIVVRNSYLNEFKSAGQDCQAIATAGNFDVQVINSYIAGAGMSFQAGGGGQQYPGQVPELMEWRGNYFTKDTRWRIQYKIAPVTTDPRYPNCLYFNGQGEIWWDTAANVVSQCDVGGASWSTIVFTPCTSSGAGCYNDVKNLWECKFCQATLLEANRFENSWSAQQNAMIVTNQVNQQAPSNRSPRDLTIRYNYLSGASRVLSMGWLPTAPVPDNMSGFRYEHNVEDQVGLWARSVGGTGIISYHEMDSVSDHGGILFRHNTTVNSPANGHQTPSYVYMSSATLPINPGAMFLDNAVQYAGGIGGDGAPNQNELYGTVFQYLASGGYSRNNVISLDGAIPTAPYVNAYNNAPCCGSGASALGIQYLPALGSSVWINPVVGGNFHINPAGTGCAGAACSGKASDGADPGADIDTVSALTAKASTGVANVALNFRLGAVVATDTTATVRYQSPDAQACTTTVSASERLTAPLGTVTDSNTGTAAQAAVTALTAGTQYWYQVGCPSRDSGGSPVTAKRRGNFRTQIVIPDPAYAAYTETIGEDIADIYADISGDATPKPDFGSLILGITAPFCNSTCGTFNTAQLHSQIDKMVASGRTVTGASLSPIPFLDNSAASITVRAKIDDTLLYAQSQGLTLILSASFLVGDFNTACGTPVTTVALLQTCLTTTHTWLNISGTDYSFYGYIAKKYTPNKFTTFQEPLSENLALGFSAGTGSAANWLAFMNAVNTVVRAINAPTLLGYSLFQGESSYNATFLTAAPLDYMAIDIFRSECCGALTKLGVFESMINAALTASKIVIAGQFWRTSWSPSFSFADGTNAFLGPGNCVWQTSGLDRQELTAVAAWMSAKGVTQIILYGSIFMETYCSTATNFNNGLDRLTDAAYASAVASHYLDPPTDTYDFIVDLIANWTSIMADRPM